jgi:hypothetical protein
MKSKITLVVGAMFLAAFAHADVLKFKQGHGVQGVLVSANSSEIVFMGLDGAENTYPVSDVARIDFAPLPPPPAPARMPPPAAMTIPAGTQITVRTVDAIDGKTAQAGGRYRATIDDPVGVGSQIAIPRGANCTLEVVSLQSGKELELRLREINVAGKTYSASTQFTQVDATGTSGLSQSKR